MEAVLIVFHLPPGAAPAQHRQFRRRVYGENTSSWRGRYHYRRRGILDNLTHVRLYWGVVIVKKEDSKQFIQLVRQNGGVAISRTVKLTKADCRTLSLHIE